MDSPPSHAQKHPLLPTLAFIATLLAADFALQFAPTVGLGAVSRTDWEYWVTCEAGDFVQQADEQGDQGWEIVSVRNVPDRASPSGSCVEIVWKRPD